LPAGVVRADATSAWRLVPRLPRLPLVDGAARIAGLAVRYVPPAGAPRVEAVQLQGQELPKVGSLFSNREHMIMLAVDPGLSGAITLLNRDSAREPQHGRAGKVRPGLDLHSLRECLAGRTIQHVFIERVSARPGQGVTSMFRFGEPADPSLASWSASPSRSAS
jgi:hypothetical protein